MLKKILLKSPWPEYKIFQDKKKMMFNFTSLVPDMVLPQ